ncbi:MAG: hypothetical protein FJY92_08365 [Candidatus Hydrogenedentes bacterium]|nr:hypothetical protein [Candidatus Hydrogenedentota bacterium]
MFRQIVLVTCAIVSGYQTSHVEAAETSKPARLIVPYAPGGSSDLVARLLADKLKDELNQRFIVENRPGAGGVLGTDLGAKAAPDGQTLLLGYTGTFSIIPNLNPKLPYDPVADFVPVTPVTTWGYLLVVHPSLPVKSVKELIALARSRPGELNYGSPGSGSVPHFAGALFQSMAKVSFVHVAYKGGGPAMLDLLGGQLHLYFASGPIALPHINCKEASFIRRCRRSPNWACKAMRLRHGTESCCRPGRLKRSWRRFTERLSMSPRCRTSPRSWLPTGSSPCTRLPANSRRSSSMKSSCMPGSSNRRISRPSRKRFPRPPARETADHSIPLLRRLARWQGRYCDVRDVISATRV